MIHDVCIQNLPVLFCIDRAGLVGSDGETHQGIFDYSLLTSIPNMSVCAPKNLWELQDMLEFAVRYDGPFAVRYPRGQAYRGLREFRAPVEYGKGEMIFEESEYALLAVGSMVSTAEHIREKWKAEGRPCTLANARFVKPVDTVLIDRLAEKHDKFVTLEENVLQGGFGLQVTAYIHQHYPHIKVLNIALPDAYVEHGNVSKLREALGIDSDSVVKKMKAFLEAAMKERLDVLLVKRNLAESREKAKAVIMSGIVYVDGQKEDKAGASFEDSVNIEVRGNTLPYVGRGGLKLEKAVKSFHISLEGKVCMDVGASTGGFTDCMLQNGAAKVYSVDVGHGQLDWKLRNDPKVVCMERTNIRYVKPEDIGEQLDFVSIDVSFISLEKVLGPVKALMKEEGRAVCLIKPQFEAGREKVGKKGVVRDRSVHEEVIEKVILFAVGLGFEVLDLEFSPIKGPEGNIEYLLYLQNHKEGETFPQIKVNPEKIVEEAHKNL